MAFTAPIFLARRQNSTIKQDQMAIEEAIDHLDCFLDIAQMQLSSRLFIAADTFSLADIQFGHILFLLDSLEYECKPQHQVVSTAAALLYARLFAQPHGVPHRANLSHP